MLERATFSKFEFSKVSALKIYLIVNYYTINSVDIYINHCLFETRGGTPIRAVKYSYIYNVKSKNTKTNLSQGCLTSTILKNHLFSLYIL